MPQNNARKGPGANVLEKREWTRQNTYDDPRLSEIVAMYEELGLEVRLEDPEKDDRCNECFKGSTGRLKTVYTRKCK